MTGEFSAQRASNAENVSISWRNHDYFTSTVGKYTHYRCGGRVWPKAAAQRLCHNECHSTAVGCHWRSFGPAATPSLKPLTYCNQNASFNLWFSWVWYKGFLLIQLLVKLRKNLDQRVLLRRTLIGEFITYSFIIYCCSFFNPSFHRVSLISGLHISQTW